MTRRGAPDGGSAAALRDDFPCVVALVTFLAAWNNAANLLRAFDRWYVPANLTVALALVWWARRCGLGWEAMGFARRRLGSGLRTGAGAAVVVGATLLAVRATPGGRRLLADARIAGLSPRQMRFLTVVRIPLGTVVLEETAFRGVLPAALQRGGGAAAAVLGSAATFGLWHVVPTARLLDANDLATTPGRRAAALASAVVAMAGAGVVLGLVRTTSGSVVAPMLVHTATNVGAAVAARSVA